MKEHPHPVLRSGYLMSSTDAVDPAVADSVFGDLQETSSHLMDALGSSLRSSGATNLAQSPGATYPPAEGRRVLHYPNVEFDFRGYRVLSRVSLTVCVDSRRSKLWTKFGCLDSDATEAPENVVSIARSFFEEANILASSVLPSLLRQYDVSLKKNGVARESSLYAFSFRGFSSSDETIKDLFRIIGEDPLKTALEVPQFRSALRDFFSLSSTDLPEDDEELLAHLSSKPHDLLVCENDRTGHKALVTANIGPLSTDLCAFGYDAPRELRDSLGYQMTSALLNQYAHHF